MDTPTSCVLLVSDEEGILEVLSRGLEQQGYEVITASDGLEALKLAKECHPDVMFMEVLLPGCNGYEISRMLKEWMDNDEKASRFPIFLLVKPKIASRDREQFIATWSRADGCLNVPCCIDEVLTRIREVV